MSPSLRQASVDPHGDPRVSTIHAPSPCEIRRQAPD
jgi:hypothetical protein